MDAETVTVGSTSVLEVSAPEAVLNVSHLELAGPNGPKSFQPASYYAPFAPGGTFKIGAPMQEIEGADDEDDEAGGAEEEEVAEAGEEDEEEVAPFLANVTVNVGGSTFVNGGTIDMVNNLAGDQLTINGPYQSEGGNLALDTFVKTSSSPTDHLTVNGPVTGTTTIYVNNLNTSGVGAFTGQGNGDGISLVSSSSNLASNAFQLGVNTLSGLREVISGAFSYQLAINGQQALLQSDLLDQIPGYVMAGSVALRHTYAGIETLYQRMGELRTGSHPAAEAADNDDKSLAPKEWKSDVVWARGNFSNYDVDVNKGWDFDSNTNGFLIGVDPSRPVGQEGVLHLGVFAGANWTGSTVDGTSFGRRTPSKVDIGGWTVGGYATFFNRLTPGQGFYADLVGKIDGLDLDMSNSFRHTKASTDAAAYTGSAEIGYGFQFGGGWSLQPSGQITFITVDQGNYTENAYGLDIHPEDAELGDRPAWSPAPGHGV